jgi:Condensation domain
VLCAAKPHWRPLDVAYVDYAAWQNAHLAGSALDAELAWWRQQLDGAPALLELPIDRPRPDTMSFAGADIGFELPSSAWQRLQQLAAEQQTTVFVVLLTALQAGAGFNGSVNTLLVNMLHTGFCIGSLAFSNWCVAATGGAAQVQCTGGSGGRHTICQPRYVGGPRPHGAFHQHTGAAARCKW